MHPGRQLTDFIKQQGAELRLAKASERRLARVSECPFDMPEELGLGQPAHQVRAVEGDQWTVGKWASLMERARHHFLAGPGFAGHEHCPFMRREAFNRGHYCPDGWRSADDPRTDRFGLQGFDFEPLRVTA